METQPETQLSRLELRILLRELFCTTERLGRDIYILQSIVFALLGLPGEENDEV